MEHEIVLELRKIINELNDGEFPLQSIIDKAKSHPTKNYNFDSEFIDELFELTYGGDVFFVLSLFYPDLDYYNQNFHVDHLHPQTLIKQKNSEYGDLLSRVSNNWNKLGNLQLLNSELNTAKNDKLLKTWAEENDISRQKLFISNETSLEFSDFEAFYNERVKCMKEKLKTLLE